MGADNKFLSLEKRLSELGRVAVAFSGGIDSTLLAYTANRTLGDQAFAISIWSPLLSAKDRNDIISITQLYDIPLIRVYLDETDNSVFCTNTRERCYVCKSMRLRKLESCAKKWNIPWILDGTNLDDLNDYRPGMKALETSKQTVCPLLECGFTKADIRKISMDLGLPVAEKPASACLASRIPTGTNVSVKILTQIDIAEDSLRNYLPENSQLRLRFDGIKAEIETEQDLVPILEEKLDFIKKDLQIIGIMNVQIAQEGYRMGRVTSIH